VLEDELHLPGERRARQSIKGQSHLLLLQSQSSTRKPRIISVPKPMTKAMVRNSGTPKV
jgi:hypothetical protein